MLNCHDATRMLSEAQDRPLVLNERARLRLHLLMCGACRRFETQVGFLRGAMRNYARRNDDDQKT
jgi:predicted anti-sigma-YlaC factor YlaD